MPKRSPRARRRPAEATGSGLPVVVVCRGGDCGNRAKHPGFDHPAQLREIRRRLEHTADVVSSSCLDACEHSNVVVVLPSSDARAAGGQAVWVGQVNDLETTDDVLSWVDAGGPVVADEPTLVAIRSFRANRLNRLELDEATGTIETTA